MTDPVPRATVRLQLHAEFPFAAACAQVPYFAALGLSHLYVSPILAARKGSRHGYDVVDHGRVNPELGGEDELARLVRTLRQHGMGLIVDIVPNHMAVGEADNLWWLDVLEWGRSSRYAGFFDIDWDVPDPALNQRLLAPFLGKPYGAALADGEITLRYDAAQGKFFFAYYGHRFPLAPQTYAAVWPEPWRKAGRDALRGSGRAAAFAEVCRRFAAATSPAQAEALLVPHGPAAALHRLLERQHYRLAWFRTAADEINWRRFFDQIHLAGLRMEQPAAFEAVHATLFRLYATGLIDGVRVDHIDGLADPRSYCRKLRARLESLAAQRPADAPPGPAYVVVEKILAPEERLPADWRVDGSTGYAFMNDVGAALHEASGEAALNALWQELTGRSPEFELEQQSARRRIAQELFSGEFNACAHALHQIARAEPATRDWGLATIRRVLLELLVQFPVYRTYADTRGRSADDARLMEQVLAATAARVAPGERPLLALMDRWLGGEPPQRVQPAAARRLRLRAMARFQQLTAPLAAKAVEDTAFYRHGRLLSRNEVGANPGQFAMSADEFHAVCARRARRYPHTLLATATHDHKRGEDQRARLAVLSELPERWAAAVRRWRAANEPLRPEFAGERCPDPGDEYMLYQTLVGAWPLQLKPADTAGIAAFFERIAAWQEKAMREAKRRTGWIEPNLDYENCCRVFLQRLRDAPAFLADLHGFVNGIAAAGALNGLAQVLLRLTAPGVPDLYQGTEFWDFSLVDPDNRAPVDYAARTAALDDAASFQELLTRWRDGRAKQRLIRNVLRCRAEHPALFRDGNYEPLEVRGAQAARLVAFARVHDGAAAVVVSPRCLATGLADSPRPGLEDAAWGDTELRLPQRLVGQPARDVIAQRPFGELPRAIQPARLLGIQPVALLLVSVPQR